MNIPRNHNILIIIILLFASCGRPISREVTKSPTSSSPKISKESTERKAKHILGKKNDHNSPQEGAKVFLRPLSIDRNKFVSHAKTYIGIPYKYGGLDKNTGLDCSGFIYNVFQHFSVNPPRASYQYTNEGIEIPVEKAKVGDIILFTGSDHSSGKVGHMGIITQESPNLQFIHSASGKKIGVIISDFKGYYVQHFVKVIRVLK